MRRARPFFERNTPTRSRRDIAAHYDLGNDLFELMLDPTMMYSGAIFERRDMTLEEASRAKLDRICDKLDLGPRDHVLEIGTGWGGFALHAAATRGCRVTTTTLSVEQRALALERVADAGLSDRVTVLLQDYRELEGPYDKLVSIEMIEAVGWKDFGTFFSRCASLLRPEGAMALQAITIDDRLYGVEKAARSFINTRIFPNGCLPSRGGDRPPRGARLRLADGRPRGHHAALRGDAAPLAGERRGRVRAACATSATTSASSACGGCT